MQLVMGIWDTRMRQIRQASQVGLIPPQHKGKGKVAHNTIRCNDARLVPLKAHFEYMMNLGEVRATRVAATLVDGVAGRSNRDDTEDMVYLPISMGYRPTAEQWSKVKVEKSDRSEFRAGLKAKKYAAKVAVERHSFNMDVGV